MPRGVCRIVVRGFQDSLRAPILHGLVLGSALYGSFTLAPLRPKQMRDCTLGILDEFDGRHAQARQADSLRTSHEPTVCRMPAVLYESHIAGDGSYTPPCIQC